MCKIIKKVTEALASLRLQYIHCPNSNQSLRHTKERFYNIACFPRVIGAIDCMLKYYRQICIIHDYKWLQMIK